VKESLLGSTQLHVGFPGRSPASPPSCPIRRSLPLPACALVVETILCKGTVLRPPGRQSPAAGSLIVLSPMTGLPHRIKSRTPVLWQKATLIRCWFSVAGLNRSGESPTSFGPVRGEWWFGVPEPPRNEPAGFLSPPACRGPMRGGLGGHARRVNAAWRCCPSGVGQLEATAAPACGLCAQGIVVPFTTSAERGPYPTASLGQTASISANWKPKSPGHPRKTFCCGLLLFGQDGQIEQPPPS